MENEKSMFQVQCRATLLRSSDRATEKFRRCQRAWRLGQFCPFSASLKTLTEAEVGLGPIQAEREGGS